MPIKLKRLGSLFFLLLLVGAALYMFLGVVWISSNEIDHYLTLSFNGKAIDATVTDVCHIVDDDDRYEVYVSFSLDSKPYTDIYYDYVENPPALGDRLSLVVDANNPTVFRKSLNDIVPMTVLGFLFSVAVYGFFSFQFTREVSAFLASKQRLTRYSSKHLTRATITSDIWFEQDTKMFLWRVTTWVLLGIVVILSSIYVILYLSVVAPLLYGSAFIVFWCIARAASRREQDRKVTVSIYKGRVKDVEVDSDLDGTVYRWDIGDGHTWIYDANCIITFRNNNPYVFKQEKVYIAKNADGKVCRIFSQKEFTAEDIE